MQSERSRGFTLIELLVVVAVVAILAAIAVPVFASKRVSARAAVVRDALRSAATAADAVVLRSGGYGILANGTAVTMLEEEGLRLSEGLSLSVDADADAYCLLIQDDRVPVDADWHLATFDSGTGAPAAVDSCTSAPTPIITVAPSPEPDPDPVEDPVVTPDPSESESPEASPVPDVAPEPSSSSPAASPAETPLVPLPSVSVPLPLPSASISVGVKL